MRRALSRLTTWMNAHGAPLLVENLAPGADVSLLDEAASELGAPLPPHLRALWSLHDGQRQELNGFFGAYNFLSAPHAMRERDTTLGAIEYARHVLEWWKHSGGTHEELHSDLWIPFAGQDSDTLAVHGLTGRVFQCNQDDSPRVVASSLADWLDAYADDVDAGLFAVVKGFGDYHLERRNFERERAQAEAARRAAEHAAMRRETPLLTQMEVAAFAGDASRCTEVLEDVIAQGDGRALSAALTILLSERSSPRLVAGALRPLLNKVMLDDDQWATVAVGGALIDNAAVRDIALRRAVHPSAKRLLELVARVDAEAASGHSARACAAAARVLDELRAR